MRARILAVLAILVWASGLQAAALPRTPSALVNGSDHLAQVGEMGPVRLTFDVRAMGAAGVHILVHRWPLKRPDAPPDREWRFQTPVGPQDVKFNHLALGVYRVVAVALDAQGQEIGSQSYPVFVEYGGPRAWDGMQRDPDLRAGPPPLAGVGFSYVAPESMPRVEVQPVTCVLKPGQEVTFQAQVRNMPGETRVDWELQGPGELQVLPEGKALYRAPGQETNQVARIRCFVPDTGAQDGAATVLVTPVQLEKQD